jgi:PAS domain S-box-containing protein
MCSDKAAGQNVGLGTESAPTDATRWSRDQIARVTLDAMVQFVGLLDARGTVLEINKVALDAVGITLADVEGKPFWTTFWWQVSDEINATLRASIERASRGEFVRWDTPIYGRAGGKETIIIDASLCPVKGEDGQVLFICAEGRDITEKKAHQQLIAQQNVELQGLLERIRELDEIKTQFFANVSHELRTPLALILGPAQRLIDDEGALTREQRVESATVIARSARMLLKHVNDLLDMSKLEAEELKIELVDTDVAALIRFLCSHFAVLATDRRIELDVVAATACVAAVDADKLQRVIMNLLGNAFKFVPDGGRVRCALAQSPQELNISIDDSGPGVKAEHRQAIFERFRQADGGINRKLGGTGLGLAIAKEFVEMHRGRIDVTDSDLGGARFLITIPRHPLSSDGVKAGAAAGELSVNRAVLDGVLEELRSVAPPATPRTAVAPASAGRPRVLVVEDNPDMNRFICECLSAQYEVIPAFDGREGLEKALQYRPALVVSDIMMPNVSGVEMIAQMRQVPGGWHTPILLLSAKADEALMVQLLDEGAQDFIVKPFSEKDLLVRVRNLIVAEQARAQAQSANRAKDEFLAMLGHELRNPLSPILTALQLMKLRGDAASERERTVIERQVNHLTRLVDDLLDVSRIAQGRVELDLQVVELVEVVANAIEMASPLIEQRLHRLLVDVPRHGLEVEVDRTRLAQIVSNLLTNAAKYTPPGGDISVRAERAGDMVVLSVRDTGIGMTAEVLPRIFELFMQEKQSLDRAQGGLGIGLSLVRSLVERHGGVVSAHSDGPGRGSELVVRLPAARAARAAEAAPAPPATPKPTALPPRAERILVVDDNEDGAEMLALALRGKGYQTHVAHDAPTALSVAAELLPDVAFLDIGLPVMDGYELATRLRKLPGLSGIRLIALTGYGAEEDRRKAREAGFDQHLVKPVAIDVIDATLRASNPDAPR